MKNLSIVAILFLCKPALISAQAFGQVHSDQMASSNLLRIIDILTRQALFVLLGIVVLFGLFYILCISKTCVDLSKQQKNTSKSYIAILVLGFGLSVLGSSCSVEQQARAEQYHKAMVAENRSCSMNQHDDGRGNAGLNNRYNASNGASNWYSPAFCKRCGQRIYRNH